MASLLFCILKGLKYKKCIKYAKNVIKTHTCDIIPI